MRHPQPGTQDPPTTALGGGSQVARAIHGMETVALLYDSEQETVSALEEFMFGETRSITDIVCVDGAPGAGQYTACTAASWGPDSTICTGSMASPLEDLCHVPTCSTQHMATIPHGWSPPAAGNRLHPWELRCSLMTGWWQHHCVDPSTIHMDHLSFERRF
ncbi:uncharacterized protein LOC107181000 isoform X7 [Panthera tigris]|uniref:uncharacterized protein LOC107181000 isoform X7 n=1 Tax=Panthera tigris TaxID=9694 RepID=UPI001C6FACF0|nr:uncharacterized protein LOC107181000 isoform X7 [Panthera tigris]